MSRKKLRHYFGSVTYIDDKFDFCLVDDNHYEEPDVFDEGGPPLTRETDPQPYDFSGECNLTDEQKSGINLIALIKKLNEEKYSDIRLHPVAYSQNSDPELLYPQIISSPLTIIDWDLGGANTAFSVIKQVFAKTQQLKVFVVYSASFQDAVKSFDGDPELKCFPRIKEAEMIRAHQCNNRSLLIIADKQHYNICSLLDFITDLFIDRCGIMPIALIDFMESAQKVSDSLFAAFSDSVADLYFLQMHYSQLNECDATEAMTMFMQNKFRDACTLDPDLPQELFQLYKDRLETYINFEDAESRFHRNIDQLIPKLGDTEKAFCHAMKKVPFSIFRRCCDDAIIKSANWVDVVDYFCSFFQDAKEIYVRDEIYSMFSPYLGLELPFVFEGVAEKKREKLHETIAQNIKDEFENFRKQICPVLLQMLISSPKMLTSSAELVGNMKYKCYDKTSVRELLEPGEAFDKKQKSEFLINKIHFGDVLIKYDKHKGNQYMLCLTPPCDAFRPEKIRLNMLFVRGSEVTGPDLNSRRKENSHLSALPVKRGTKKELRYINWKFYDIIKVDLNDVTPHPELNDIKSYTDLYEWERPYMMAEPYARQIANAFTAYFSRAGVDELFIKSEPPLRRIFK